MVSMLGNTELVWLVFIQPGAKVNCVCYGDVLLNKNIPPAIHSIAEETFTFQQDNAAAHRARDTVEYLSRHSPASTVVVATQQIITQSGACCRDKSTIPGSTVSTTLSSILSKSGITSTTESLSRCSTVACLSVSTRSWKQLPLEQML